MAKNIADTFMEVVKGGLVDGPTLYLTGKLVDVAGVAAGNFFPNTSDTVLTPLTGLALGVLPLMLSDHWLAEKISEYTVANAIADTLESYNGGSLDLQVDTAFLPIANMGLPAGQAAYTTTTIFGVNAQTVAQSQAGTTAAAGAPAGTPAAGAAAGTTQGYMGMGRGRGRGQRGYVPMRGYANRAGVPQLSRRGGLIQQAPSAAYRPAMNGGMRSARMRGFTTELR